MGSVALKYKVVNVAETTVERDVMLEGEVVTATIKGLSVQMVSDGHGSIVLNLTKGQAGSDHPFVDGEDIVVTFGSVAGDAPGGV
jgi:hypothetical protein